MKSITDKPRSNNKTDNPFMVNRRDYDREKVCEVVFDKIRTSSKSVISILAEGCDGHTFPNRLIFYKWLRDDSELASNYARAKRDQADFLAEELLKIADDGQNDWMEKNDPNNPGYALNGEHSSRSRLRVDTRKWIMARMNPKKYGDRMIHAGDGESPVVVEQRLAADADELMKKIKGGE